MNKRNKVLWTSDWHTGDENCIMYDDRPFHSLKAMERALVKRYNNLVNAFDVVYFLGDMGRDEKSVIHKLNGIKIKIQGNHDHSGMYALMEAGYHAVLHMGSLMIGSSYITFTHCPLRGIVREDISNMKGTREGEHWHGESRHQNFCIPDWGQYHLHGHVHSPNHGKSVKILDRQFDVGVVANGYAPVTISQIESWIALHKKS